MVIRVRPDAGEKEALHVSLQRQREIVLWKLDGLTDEQLRQAMVPSGTHLLGLVKHLASAEYGWFCQAFGRETEPLPDVDADPEADMRVEADESTADILGFYERARTAADEMIAATDLDTMGTAWHGGAVSMRWVLVHMNTEIARHAGHMDIVRELIDGQTGLQRLD